MSSKTRTRKTRTTNTTGSARTLRSVPDQMTAAKVRTDTEDKLWQALHAWPDCTAADLSAAAGIGKSTAQKILVKWAGDGSVTRTPGIAEGGRRAADLWAITAPEAAPEADASDAPADGAPTHEATVEDAAPVDTAQGEPTTVPADPDTADAATPAEGFPIEPTTTEQSDAAADDAQDTADTEASDPAEATEPTNDGAATDADTDGNGDEKAERLAPGALRGMVEDYLRDHPGEEFGPTAIAKALGGKSSGAVSNALDKLVEDNTAVKTKDKPRRFSLAPAEAAAPAPTN
jgi:hypothetical protein